MTNQTLVLLSGVGALVLAGLAAAFGISANKKMKRVASSVGKTIDELSNKDLDIDISTELVEKAAVKQVERRVDEMLPGVKGDALKRAEKVFDEAIKKEIDSQYASTREDVKRALKERIGTIDISSIKREVLEDAKYEAQEKFKDQLDDVLDKFNGQLDDVGRIYTSIAKKFSEK